MHRFIYFKALFSCKKHRGKIYKTQRVLVANLETNFWILVGSTIILVVLATVLGAISCPDCVSISGHFFSFLSSLSFREWLHNFLFVCSVYVCICSAHFLPVILFYYIEESVLLGTKPHVGSIRHFIRDPSGVFSVCYLCECRIIQWNHDSRLLLLLNYWFLASRLLFGINYNL